MFFRIMQTDQQLERLLTFNSNAQFYVVPESLRHGTALCNLPPGGVLSSDLPLNHKLGTKSVYCNLTCLICDFCDPDMVYASPYSQCLLN